MGRSGIEDDVNVGESGGDLVCRQQGFLSTDIDAGQENAAPELFDDGLSEGLGGYAKADSAAIERVEHDCQGAGPKPSQQAFDIWEW